MPQLRDITVHITDADGNDLEEWGVQNLRGNRISAYIKSTTDMPFMVKLRPRIPYPDELRLREDLRRNIKKEAADGTYIKQEDTDNNTQDWTLRSPERSLGMVLLKGFSRVYLSEVPLIICRPSG